MQYGDIVIYVENDTEINALVESYDQPTDSVTIAFLHPRDNSHGLKAPTVSTLRGVKRLDDKNLRGWKEWAPKAVSAAQKKADTAQGKADGAQQKADDTGFKTDQKKADVAQGKADAAQEKADKAAAE